MLNEIKIQRRDEMGELFEIPISQFQSLKKTNELEPQGVPPMIGEGSTDPLTRKASEIIGDAMPLANRKAPYYHVQQEKPHHRVFLELAAKGYTVKEIAEQTGFTTVCVNNILRQEHTQQFLVNEIRDIHSVDDEVVQVIKQSVVEAVSALANIVRDTGSKGSDRIAAANALLDRRYGKPNQPINRGTDVDLSKLTDDELAAMLPTKGTSTAGEI